MLLRIISPSEYDRIECNGCGHCCSSFRLDSGDPLTIIQKTANGRISTYDAMWFGQLTPTWREDIGTYVYACSYLEEADDLRSGRCTIHEVRPDVCRDYPNGRDGKAGGVYEYCSWGQVEVLDFEVEVGIKA